ncbi:hypothetical protein PUN28_015246 [Cardiocondyla obscurior]|uniref:Uncharacterized protein n=1 Tax=Cardiocondyla obscurior TaxID=286306 RepID=A0AAW2F1H2_9HYME
MEILELESGSKFLCLSLRTTKKSDTDLSKALDLRQDVIFNLGGAKLILLPLILQESAVEEALEMSM